MVIESRYSGPLISLLVAAGLGCWLLWQPELVRGLSWPWRAVLVALGIWGLGTAFARPLAMARGDGRLWRLTAASWSRVALWGFALLMVLRWLLT